METLDGHEWTTVVVDSETKSIQTLNN